MSREIPFSFLRDVRGGDASSFCDRQKINKQLRGKGVPIDIGGLDVLISLWTLPPSACQFECLFDDMITLLKIKTESGTSPDEKEIQKRQLKTRLNYLEQHKMVKIDKKERYRMTRKGEEIMERARIAIT